MDYCCPLCFSKNLVENLFVKNEVFACVGKLSNTVFSNSEKASINLFQCCDCGFIYNKEFDAEKISRGYKSSEYVLRKAISPSITSKIKQICSNLLTLSSNDRAVALEIGCGNGDMSYALSDNVKTLYTVDPSEESNIVKSLSNIVHINDFFNRSVVEKHLPIKVDIIVLRHIIEHIDSPFEFIELLSSLANIDCILYVEVPNIDEIIKSGRFFDIFHDHFGYYQQNTLINIFSENGFTWLNTDFFHNKQHQGLFFKKVTGKIYQLQPFVKYGYSDFSLFQEHITEINNTIKNYDKVAIYGAGAHANCILNYITENNKKRICLCMDKDKTKQNKYLQSSDIVIVEPCLANVENIDAILMASALYENEIIDDLCQYFQGYIIKTANEIEIKKGKA